MNSPPCNPCAWVPSTTCRVASSRRNCCVPASHLCLEQQTARDDAAAARACCPGQLPRPACPASSFPATRLLDTLGESPRATVYLATSEALNRNVALKVSHVSETDEAQFSREYAAIGAMRHPAVVDIYDYGVFDGREYIAMEYFPCGDLKARILNPDHRRRGHRLPQAHCRLRCPSSTARASCIAT